jgi:hypothetical protein
MIEAIREAVGSSVPDVFRFVVRPPVATTFVSKASPGDSEEEARFEADLLGLLDGPGDTVRMYGMDDSENRRMLVSVVPERLGETLHDICDELHVSGFEIIPGVRAASEVIQGFVRGDGSGLAVGSTESANEAVLLAGREWKLAVSADRGEINDEFGTRLQALLATMEHSGRGIRVFHYGWSELSPPIREIAGSFGIVPVDALSLVQHDSGGLEPNTISSNFTAAIGAAIL